MDEKTIIKTDLVLQLVHFRMKVPLAFIGPLSILLAFALIPIALITGVWSGIEYPMKLSYTTWIGSIFLCLANIFIIKYYISIPKVLNELDEKGVIYGEKDVYLHFLEEIKGFYNLKYRKVIVLFLSLLISIFLHIQFRLDGLHGWTEIDAVNGWSILGYYNMFILTIELNIIINLFLNIAISVKVLKRLVQKVKNGELKYDFIRLCCFNSGGLKPFGDLALKCNVIFVALGFYGSVLVYTLIQTLEKFGIHFWQILEISQIPIYLAIMVMIFFKHLFPIHKLMQFRKQELLDIITKMDQNSFALEKNSIVELLKEKSKYEELKYKSDVFDLINRLPTWPFNRKLITKFITAILLPIIPILLELIK